MFYVQTIFNGHLKSNFILKRKFIKILRERKIYQLVDNDGNLWKPIEDKVHQK